MKTKIEVEACFVHTALDIPAGSVSAPRHLAVIWASARSELAQFSAPQTRLGTRTKMCGVTSSYDSARSRISGVRVGHDRRPHSIT